MARYQRRVVNFEPAMVTDKDLINITEATFLLNRSYNEIIAAIKRGTFTEIVDAEKPGENSWLLRKEIESFAQIDAETAEWNKNMDRKQASIRIVFSPDEDDQVNWPPPVQQTE